MKGISKQKKTALFFTRIHRLFVLAVVILVSKSPIALADVDQESPVREVQEPPIEDQEMGMISVTASRVAEAIKDTPVAIEIIDQQALETVKFVDSRDELLNRIPGNSLSRNLRIPIGGKNYTINLLDGMAVRSFGRGTNGFIDEVNTFDIERVEVIKGPASALYGSNALGGVINVITRDPPSHPEYRAWGELGNNDRVRGGVSAAGSRDDLGYFFDLNGLDYEGGQERTALERKTVSGKLIRDFDVDASLSLRAEYLETSEESPGSLDQAAFDQDWQQAAIDDAYTDQQILSATVGYVTGLGPQSEVEIKYAVRSHEEQGMPSWNATADYGEDDMLNHNLVATYHRDFDRYRSRVIAGLDLQRSHVEEDSYDARSSDSNIELDRSWNIVAEVASPFLQYEISPVAPMRVSLGARYDRVTYDANNLDHSLDDRAEFSNLTPKAGATYELNKENSLWFGYNTGFVVPSRSALFSSTRYITDPDLKPEKAKNIDFGLRGRLMAGRLTYDVALYDTKIRDMVVVEDRPGMDAYVNAGEIEVKGVETSLSYRPLDGLRFALAHTYARNKYREYVTGSNDYSGNYLAASPLHHLNARVTWTPRAELDLELEWDHLTAYHTNSDNSADPQGQYERPDLFHLRVSYGTGPWSLWAHALNLFDKQYAERVSYSVPSRFSSGGRSFTSGTERSLYAGVSYTWH